MSQPAPDNRGHIDLQLGRIVAKDGYMYGVKFIDTGNQDQNSECTAGVAVPWVPRGVMTIRDRPSAACMNLCLGGCNSTLAEMKPWLHAMNCRISCIAGQCFSPAECQRWEQCASWAAQTTQVNEMVSFEVFKRSPQPLKAGIVATAVFRRFLDFNMYRQRCISAGSVAACSACDLFRPAASPYLSPCTLAKPKLSESCQAEAQSD